MQEFTVGDTEPALTGTVNANLTGATVELHLLKPDGTTALTRDTGNGLAVTAAATGAWAYTWSAGDLDVDGLWSVELEALWAGGRRQTFARDAEGHSVQFKVRRQYA